MPTDSSWWICRSERTDWLTWLVPYDVSKRDVVVVTGWLWHSPCSPRGAVRGTCGHTGEVTVRQLFPSRAEDLHVNIPLAAPQMAQVLVGGQERRGMWIGIKKKNNGVWVIVFLRGDGGAQVNFIAADFSVVTSGLQVNQHGSGCPRPLLGPAWMNLETLQRSMGPSTLKLHEHKHTDGRTRNEHLTGGSHSLWYIMWRR